ncbi:hypothetical protein ACF0H5_012931 [Mactra antiquata]
MVIISKNGDYLGVFVYFGYITICVSLPVTNIASGKLELQTDGSKWSREGVDEVYRMVNKQTNTKVAKNIILFIGDGMGVTTMTAARILDGQLKGQSGEDNKLYFETYDHTSLAKTYCLDKMTPDSASTATAMLTGVKTNYKILGMDGNAVVNNCSHSMKYSQKLQTILHWAQKLGKRTGIVSTARVTHATPAAAYSHTANRDWEGDVNMEQQDAPCKDIARQLIEDNPTINVILGGGRRHFLPNTMRDPGTGRIEDSQRADGRDLIKEWLSDKRSRNSTYSYVWNRDQFLNVSGNKEYLLGLFSSSHMSYDIDRRTSGKQGEPSLSEMTNKAIDILSKGQNGYFLLVEGARIDHGHHDNKAKKALYDVLAFDNAVKAAGSRPESSPDTTLSIVTADHSHVFNIVGYPQRGSDVLGLVRDTGGLVTDQNGKPYTILHYSNGPSYTQNINLRYVNTTTAWFPFPAGYSTQYETHGGEDVVVYAKGPMSHLVRGSHEQTYITYVMAYSACIGPFLDPSNSPVCSSGRV